MPYTWHSNGSPFPLYDAVFLDEAPSHVSQQRAKTGACWENILPARGIFSVVLGDSPYYDAPSEFIISSIFFAFMNATALKAKRPPHNAMA